MRTTFFLTCALAALCPTGCGKSPPAIVPAQGTVRLDGRPLKNVKVLFYPRGEPGADYLATGVTDEKGHFQLICKGQAGACACDNQVVLAEGDLPDEVKGESFQAQKKLGKYLRSLGGRPLPEKYTNLVDTPIAVTVQAGQAEYNLDLRH